LVGDSAAAGDIGIVAEKSLGRPFWVVATGVPAASFCGFVEGAAARVAIVDEGGASAADGETSGAAETLADVSLGVSIVDMTGADIGMATERSTGAVGGVGATAALVGVTPGLSSGELFRSDLARVAAIAVGIPTIDACGILLRSFFRLVGGDCAVVGSAPGDGGWALVGDGD
jgi:hypothetical protein